MDSTIIGAIIQGVAAILAGVIGFFTGKTHEKKNRNTVQQVPDYTKKKIHSVKLYAINSRFWANDIFCKGYEIDQCTIFLRDYIKTGSCDKKAKYDTELDEAIKIWKDLYKSGKIQTLRIYKYDHLSDFYYCIINNECVYTAPNLFDNNNSTGQSNDSDSVILYGKSHKRMTQKYVRHFQNMLTHYKDSIVESLP